LSHAANPIGFTLDVGFGRAWQIFHSADPARGGNEYIPQAFVSLKPERWGGLQFDSGKFYTSAGAELTSKDLNILLYDENVLGRLTDLQPERMEGETRRLDRRT